MNLAFAPIARDTCDHKHEEDHYTASRRLKHLLRARTQTCTAPACNAQALYCDIDHTVPYPDTTTWTTPAGRTHTTTPTTYDL